MAALNETGRFGEDLRASCQSTAHEVSSFRRARAQSTHETTWVAVGSIGVSRPVTLPNNCPQCSRPVTLRFSAWTTEVPRRDQTWKCPHCHAENKALCQESSNGCSHDRAKQASLGSSLPGR
jgi:hypothetical protein